MKQICANLLIGLMIFGIATAQEISVDDMKGHLENYERDASLLCNKQAKANWDVQTDVLNEEKVVVQNAVNLEYANYRKSQHASYWSKVENVEFYKDDPIMYRQLQILKDVGTAALDDSQLTALNGARNSMSRVYNNARVCPFSKQNCNLATEGKTLDPDLENILSSSEDFDEQKYIWEQWHEKSGKLMREDFKIYVNLNNQAADKNGYKDAGEMWRSRYEDDKLVEKVDKLWDDVKPLYDELHKYVRNELRNLYGKKIDKKSEFIPAHLTGNMWAQSWINLYDRTKPFKNASLVDVTAKMVALGYDAKKMFEIADDFYTSMGLPTTNMSFSEKAVIEKPEQVIACHASAWDFCDKEDFRIKMCTKVNNEDFITIHHELGHIMYYLLYKDQPLLFRTGANPGFHEAVGDTIALSVSTPQHLKTVGLLDNYDDSEADNINALFFMALERVAFLPFGLLIDKYRWDIFSGAVPENQWNQHWWKLREQYQKIQAPSVRGEEFFDAGAKYHVPADVPYIRYFVAHILEFSFYKSLCIEAGQYDPAKPLEKPLHKCDFYQNKAAGTKLKAGLELGLSKHWNETLKTLTGEDDMSAQALMEYFAPLYTFLKKQNEASDLLDRYEVEATAQCNKLVKAEWDVATDTESKPKQDAYTAAVIENAKFSKDYFNTQFKDLKPADYTNEAVARQLKFLTKLGRDILDETELSELTRTLNKIEGIYNTAKICPFDKQQCNLTTEGLTLDPEISERMTKSQNFDELKWVWDQWHEQSGKKMRTDFKTYVNLVNKAAVDNGQKDNGVVWREWYEDDDFVKNVDKMWDEVKPLYDELQTYVRKKLLKIYDKQMDKDSDLIPAHLLGNMWAQSWVNLYDRIKPYPDASLIDVTDKIKEKMSIYQMFQESDRFYKALGLESNDMSYNETLGAVIEKPKDKIITCHASAWDFCDGSDYRIKMCTNIDQEDFVTVHHEMGHIQYFILYKHQPVTFRTGANPGFHEAVGDLIALSVSTPTHLKKIGLLDNYADSKEDNINALFKMALERLAFMPFGLLIDKWRWEVFSGEVKEENWNKRWWELREKYQKVSPPSVRTENDFDPGAKYHVPADVPYIRYFIAHILQFQMQKAVCIEAGLYDPKDENKPLHKCDIDGSLAAGKKIRDGLELGLSKHWSVALEKMTGEKVISGKAVVEYFQPLYEFLKEENAKDSSTGLLVSIVLIIGSLSLLRFI